MNYIKMKSKINSNPRSEENIRLLEVIKQKALSKRQKQLSALMVMIGIIFAFLVGAPYLGAMFTHNIEVDEEITGWCALSVYYMGINKEIQEFSGDCKIRLYYAENGSIYADSLTLDDFPYYLSAPTSMLFNESGGEFEPYYGMLLGNPHKNNPYENSLFLRREVHPSNIEVQTSLFNFTYSNYTHIDPYEPLITEYELGYNETSNEDLPFGAYSPRIRINISSIPFGYSWGVNSMLPPDIFEAYHIQYPITYHNKFNWKGLFLGFDAEVSVRLLLYGAETYNFFEQIRVFCINLTLPPTAEQLWVVRLPTMDIPSALIIEFSAISPLSNIYLWSGVLDEYASQYIYNTYSITEVI